MKRFPDNDAGVLPIGLACPKVIADCMAARTSREEDLEAQDSVERQTERPQVARGAR